jgi:hypothetical protein
VISREDKYDYDKLGDFVSKLAYSIGYVIKNNKEWLE